jgi:hypothetical protein
MHFTILMLACTGTEEPKNEPPTVNSVSTTPAKVYEDTTISATAAASDPEGEDVELTFTWTVNGAEVQSGVLQTLSGANFAKGDTVVVTVTAFDGEETSAATPSADVLVLNTGPTIDGATILPERPTGGDDLSIELVGAHDDDGDEVFFSVEWWVRNALVSTDATLSADYISRNDTVYAKVTATDGEDDGNRVQSETVTVANAAPVATSVAISPTEGVGTNDTLTASGDATDADGDTVIIRLDWYVDDVWVSQGPSLDGKLYFDRDQVVHVVATGNDSIEQGEGLASESVTIGNAAPTAPTVSIDPSEDVNSGDDLTCLVPEVGEEGEATDPDDDVLDYVFTWSVNGAAWTGDTTDTTWVGDTISFADTTIYDEWTCSVVATDGTATGPSAEATVEIGDVYKIDDADLVGMTTSCSTTTQYNGCYGNDWGFGWTDGGTATPTSVTIELNHGLSCETGYTYETYLNGTTTTETLDLIYSCSCSPTETEYTLELTDMTDYVVGGDNEFLIEGVDCEGLTKQTDWDAYAKVTVNY